MKLPLTFEEISEEIERFTDLRGEEIRQRVWAEALSLGCNANRDARTLSVTPHVFDERMQTLYDTTDAFIFECLVFWAKPSRQAWIKQALARISLFAAARNVKPSELKILIFGDGAGSDSLFLAAHELRVDYFDVPGSQTFDFAARRFDFYGARPAINLITDYDGIATDFYDVVISFEVLEHLPEPLAAVRDISKFLKPDGIALITEAFDFIFESCPTHLESNRRYAGRTGFIFGAENLALTWYSREPLFKPMEFQKKAAPVSVWRLCADRKILSNYINNRLAFYKVRVKNILDKNKSGKPDKSDLQIARAD